VSGPNQIYSIWFPSNWKEDDAATRVNLGGGKMGWEDGLVIDLPGQDRPIGRIVLAYYQTSLQYSFAECPSPDQTTLDGRPATHCGWGDGALSLDRSLVPSLANVDGYYVPLKQGRIAVGVQIDGWGGVNLPNGSAINSDPAVEQEARQILGTLRINS
jgi:hypothetical protein